MSHAHHPAALIALLVLVLSPLLAIFSLWLRVHTVVPRLLFNLEAVVLLSVVKEGTHLVAPAAHIC